METKFGETNKDNIIAQTDQRLNGKMEQRYGMSMTNAIAQMVQRLNMPMEQRNGGSMANRCKAIVRTVDEQSKTPKARYVETYEEAQAMMFALLKEHKCAWIEKLG